MTLEIDQTVWVKPIGNNARRGMNTDPIEATVSKIGRKYFELMPTDSNRGWALTRVKFHIASGLEVSDFTADYQVYETKQEILDEARHVLLCGKLYDYFNAYGKKGTLSQLEAIAEILELEVEKPQSINL